MFKIYTVSALFLIVFCGINVRAAADCDDSGVCKLPGASPETSSSVLSPVGKRRQPQQNHVRSRRSFHISKNRASPKLGYTYGKSRIQTLEIILFESKPRSVKQTTAIQTLQETPNRILIQLQRELFKTFSFSGSFVPDMGR